jgi:hypothetical protein
MDWKRVGLGILTITVVFVLAFAGAASGSKTSRDHHMLITFSGTANGMFSWSEPQQTNPDGSCVQPAMSYTSTDHYTFSWSEKFSYPEGVGSYVHPKDYKISGTDHSKQVQPECTNDFGNGVGGDSFDCVDKWGPLPSSDTDYPSLGISLPRAHRTVSTFGGASLNTAPTGTNCVGAPVGMSLYGFSAGKLKGEFKFSASKLRRKGTLSMPVSVKNSSSCGGNTCDSTSCKDDGPAGPVPVTCSTDQSYTAELKVQLVK